MFNVYTFKIKENVLHKIKLYGLGGQGVVTAAVILAHAVSIHENKYAKTIPAYGHERRGAPVFSDVMIDDERILLSSFVYEPNLVVIFDSSVIHKGVNVAKGIQESTVLVLNADNEESARLYKEKYNFKQVYYVNASKIAIERLGKNIPNGAMLGALARTGVVKIESIMKSLGDFFGEEKGVTNANTAREAYEQIKQI
jgi:2-oxoacid:acceptor oxidoreductase gamma subunit (pyruvate/2-ketoisovalerate family)